MGTADDGILRCASGTPVPDLGSAIAHAVYDRGEVTVRAIGNGAIGQCMKAVCAARGYAAPKGLNLASIPGFVDIDIRGETVTGMNIRVIPI